VVVELGETVIAALVAPVLQEYDVAPLAVKVVDCPWFIVTLDGEITTCAHAWLYPNHSLMLAGSPALGLAELSELIAA
jgi:urea transporter